MSNSRRGPMTSGQTQHRDKQHIRVSRHMYYPPADQIVDHQHLNPGSMLGFEPNMVKGCAPKLVHLGRLNSVPTTAIAVDDICRLEAEIVSHRLMMPPADSEQMVLIVSDDRQSVPVIGRRLPTKSVGAMNLDRQAQSQLVEPLRSVPSNHQPVIGRRSHRMGKHLQPMPMFVPPQSLPGELPTIGHHRHHQLPVNVAVDTMDNEKALRRYMKMQRHASTGQAVFVDTVVGRSAPKQQMKTRAATGYRVVAAESDIQMRTSVEDCPECYSQAADELVLSSRDSCCSGVQLDRSLSCQRLAPETNRQKALRPNRHHRSQVSLTEDRNLQRLVIAHQDRKHEIHRASGSNRNEIRSGGYSMLPDQERYSELMVAPSPVSSDHGPPAVHPKPARARYLLGENMINLRGSRESAELRCHQTSKIQSRHMIEDAKLLEKVDQAESEMSQMYESLAAELKAKLGDPKMGPILLPPKDYDTMSRKQGKLSGIELRRSTNPQLVGPKAVRPISEVDATCPRVDESGRLELGSEYKAASPSNNSNRSEDEHGSHGSHRSRSDSSSGLGSISVGAHSPSPATSSKSSSNEDMRQPVRSVDCQTQTTDSISECSTVELKAHRKRTAPEDCSTSDSGSSETSIQKVEVEYRNETHNRARQEPMSKEQVTSNAVQRGSESTRKSIGTQNHNPATVSDGVLWNGRVEVPLKINSEKNTYLATKQIIY